MTPLFTDFILPFVLVISILPVPWLSTRVTCEYTTTSTLRTFVWTLFFPFSLNLLLHDTESRCWHYSLFKITFCKVFCPPYSYLENLYRYLLFGICHMDDLESPFRAVNFPSVLKTSLHYWKLNLVLSLPFKISSSTSKNLPNN